MNNALKIIGASLTGTIVVTLGAFLGGTLVWLIWPIAIPATFPGLVASGVLSAKLSWRVAVCLTWLFGCLIKSSVNIKS